MSCPISVDRCAFLPALHQPVSREISQLSYRLHLHTVHPDVSLDGLVVPVQTTSLVGTSRVHVVVEEGLSLADDNEPSPDYILDLCIGSRAQVAGHGQKTKNSEYAHQDFGLDHISHDDMAVASIANAADGVAGGHGSSQACLNSAKGIQVAVGTSSRVAEVAEAGCRGSAYASWSSHTKVTAERALGHAHILPDAQEAVCMIVREAAAHMDVQDSGNGHNDLADAEVGEADIRLDDTGRNDGQVPRMAVHRDGYTVLVVGIPVVVVAGVVRSLRAANHTGQCSDLVLGAADIS